MFKAMHLGPTREVTSLGVYDTYQEAKDCVSQAVIQHRNMFGRKGSIGSSYNSASRHPFRVEIVDSDFVDIYYVSQYE